MGDIMGKVFVCVWTMYGLALDCVFQDLDCRGMLNLVAGDTLTLLVVHDHVDDGRNITEATSSDTRGWLRRAK